MGALRLARAATGRDVIVKVAGGYHGAIDGLLAEAGSGLTTLGVPSSPGVTAATTAATRIVPYNDADGRGPRPGGRGGDDRRAGGREHGRRPAGRRLPRRRSATPATAPARC